MLGFICDAGFHGQQGHIKNNIGKVSNAQKKGSFGSAGHLSKAHQNSGKQYGRSNGGVKHAKGYKFGAKGAHKKVIWKLSEF